MASSIFTLRLSPPARASFGVTKFTEAELAPTGIVMVWPFDRVITNGASVTGALTEAV
ncbi:hypothetical protein D9M68_907590 [compost metagenome]